MWCREASSKCSVQPICCTAARSLKFSNWFYTRSGSHARKKKNVSHGLFKDKSFKSHNFILLRSAPLSSVKLYPTLPIMYIIKTNRGWIYATLPSFYKTLFLEFVNTFLTQISTWHSKSMSMLHDSKSKWFCSTFI